MVCIDHAQPMKDEHLGCTGRPAVPYGQAISLMKTQFPLASTPPSVPLRPLLGPVISARRIYWSSYEKNTDTMKWREGSMTVLNGLNRL